MITSARERIVVEPPIITLSIPQWRIRENADAADRGHQSEVVIQGSGWGSAPRGCRGSACMGRRGLRLRPRRGLGWPGDKNFYAHPMAQYGFEREGRRVQGLYLAGDRERAARALPAELIDTVSIYGPAEVVRDSLLADRDAGGDALIVMPVAESTEVRIGRLRHVARLTKEERMP
jgi:hypothetical protein